MTLTVFILLRALVGTETGRCCRVCCEPIPHDDPFGLSEGVCRACRS